MDNILLTAIFVLFGLIALVVLWRKVEKKKPKPCPPRPHPIPDPIPCPAFKPDSDDPKPLKCDSCYDSTLPTVYRQWMFERNASCLSDPSLPHCAALNKRFKNELLSGTLLTGRDTLYGDGTGQRACGCLNG